MITIKMNEFVVNCSLTIRVYELYYGSNQSKMFWIHKAENNPGRSQIVSDHNINI